MDLLLLALGLIAIIVILTVAAIKYKNRFEKLQDDLKHNLRDNLDDRVVTLSRREIEALDAEELFNLVQTKLRNATANKS